MRVDVVTGPVRYRALPLLGLLLLATIPAAALTAVLVWSDREADAHEAQQIGVPSATDQLDELPPATPALTTPVLAYRRSPERLAAVAADNRLATAMDQLYTFVDERSCVAVGVDGRTVTTRNPASPVIPASVHKLLVAAVALEVLGPEHRFTTEVRAPAAVEGVVDGDLHLVGGGDPLLTSADYPISEDPYPAFNVTSLDALADAVVASGITTVRGAVIGDGTRYDDAWVNPSWGPGVAGVDAGPYDALFVNDARTVGRSGRQPDPNAAAAREFVRLLEARGVDVGNGWASGVAPVDVPVVASVQSVPLPGVIDEMLTTSDNDTAELLLKELSVHDGTPGTVAGGLEVLDRTLRTWGVPMEGVRLVDASGLSADNRLTCATVLAVLDRAAGTTLVAGLPVAGRTGTLAGELIGTAVEGRLAAKTGTLGNPPDGFDPPAVKALAGYLDAPDGSNLRFVLVLNADGTTTEEVYRAYWDALAVRLADYPTGPERVTLGPR